MRQRSRASFVFIVVAWACGWWLQGGVPDLVDRYRDFGVDRVAVAFERAGEPRAGEVVLSRRARAAISLIRDAELESYRLVGSMASNEAFRQRIAEGAWPIRPRQRSEFRLGATADLAQSGCPVVGHSGGVSLVDCRR